LTFGGWLSPARRSRATSAWLLAECDDVPLAAIGLSSNVMVADPYHPPLDAARMGVACGWRAAVVGPSW
jgi:hypothetical protein